MSNLVYYILCLVLTCGVLWGIAMMSKVKTAVRGNLLSALCTAIAILLTLYRYQLLTQAGLWIALFVGLGCGLFAAQRVKMIEMPQAVALLNGFGGAASALVALVSILGDQLSGAFAVFTGVLALAVGTITLTGSLIAAGKLHKLINQRPVVWKNHSAIVTVSIVATAVLLVVKFILPSLPLGLISLLTILVSGFFGVAFAIRVGGADMPITISLLNSLSGVAGSIAGMAIGDPLLVAIGGVVGASGLLLTQIMCRSMNRKLMDILLGKTSAPAKKEGSAPAAEQPKAEAPAAPKKDDPAAVLKAAKKVIIVPGYGMALAQAQGLVKQIADQLRAGGAEVKFAIHPVAGRMPGHMNVLLCEVDVDYEDLYEMDVINPEFAEADAVLVIGANDVLNPAANTAEGTPIYGMPVLDVGSAKHIVICNYDLKPGYAGVDNPLYSREEGVSLILGNAAETLQQLSANIANAGTAPAEEAAADAPGKDDPAAVLKAAKKVIIVPGYGMALAQAQGLVKQIADQLRAGGAEVKFAIHPVAGRMPGHMNVLLCEVDVDYEDLYEMDVINPEFAEADAVLVIGANDVLNPAANTAEGTPIYGMPVLDVGSAKHIVICNYDLKPGYAGVDNPLYSREEGVSLILGNAAETLQQLSANIAKAEQAPAAPQKDDPAAVLKAAKKVIIVPGYGMALAQAQGLVKQVADRLRANGAEVKFAIHPVAGRMPGHMNVLLCEVDVDYEDLYEMDVINPEFAEADAVLVIGANDVLNPAANTAEGTPIYGMPVLDVAAAKHIVICNYDLKPGYAGVDNPLYTKESGVSLILGNAAETLQQLLASL